MNRILEPPRLEDRVLNLTIIGEPEAKARPRWGRGRTYTPDRTRHAEAVIAWEASLVLERPLNDDHSCFWLKCEFHCARKTGPDVDNLVKLVMDSLSPRRIRGDVPPPGLIWRNDRQVVILEARRYDRSSKPKTWIRVFKVVD